MVRVPSRRSSLAESGFVTMASMPCMPGLGWPNCSQPDHAASGGVRAGLDRGALSVASRGPPLGADRKNLNSNKKPLEATDRAPRSRAGLALGHPVSVTVARA